MMTHGHEVPAGYGFGGGGIELLDLPYGGKAFSMTIVLPRDAGGIDSLIPALTEERWSAWTAALDAGSESVEVYLPKFVMTYGLSMNGVLSALGMPSAFDCGGASDFTRMASLQAGALCISEVRHKATVEVNEEGTEAAAATSGGIQLTSGPPTVVVDHPFVFVIRERFSGTILFMGRVMNPALRD
jgi:serine protease inhibitor